MTGRKRRRRPLLLLLLALISVCCIGIALTLVSGNGSPSTIAPTTAPPATPMPRTIETAEGYTFTVPGTAFLDGRALETQPPLTLMNINVWGQVPRVKVVCKLQHGSEVQLLDVQYYESEARHYFLVQSGGCRGWLSENFLSTEKQAPVGDQF